MWGECVPRKMFNNILVPPQADTRSVMYGYHPLSGWTNWSIFVQWPVCPQQQHKETSGVLALVCIETIQLSERLLEKSAGCHPFVCQQGNSSWYCTVMVTDTGPLASSSQEHRGDKKGSCGFWGVAETCIPWCWFHVYIHFSKLIETWGTEAGELEFEASLGYTIGHVLDIS